MILVAYDISNNSIRNTRIKLLRGMGFYRVQKSVFVGDIKWKVFKGIIKQANFFINPETDIISCYHLNQDDYDKSITLGNFKDPYFADLEDFMFF